MKKVKYRHLQLEQDTWLRTLDYIQEENIFLKNHLADVIMNDIHTSILEQAEYFQSLFVDKDVAIALLRYDIAGQSRYTVNEKQLNDDLDSILKMQDRLRGDINKIEQEFCILKVQFNKFMAINL